MPPYINILHLSDLHLKRDGPERFNQSQVLDALATDLQILNSGALRPDLLIFSGDLAYSADEGVYGDVEQALVAIAEAAKLPREAVILAPGNHDVQQTIALSELDLIDRARGFNASATKTNELYFDQEVVSYIGRAFSKFTHLASRFGSDPVASNSFGSLFLFEKLKVAIVTINTAILSKAGLPGAGRDEGNLNFPEMALLHTLKEAPSDYIRVVVGHHPLEMLNPVAAKTIRNALFKEANIYLFGHMHEANPQNVQTPVGECTLIQAGALYASRDWWNGYAVVSAVAGSNHHRIHLRRWYEQRREFGVASEYDDHGLLFLSPAARDFWQKVEPRLDLKALDSWRESKLRPALDRECNQTLTKQRLDSVYVDPEFERDVYVETEEGKQLRNKPDILTLQNVMNSSENFIIAARPESGKTALIRRWAAEMARKSARDPGWTIPIILDYPQLKSYAGGIETAARRRLAELPEGIRAQNLLDTGMATVLVDDLKLEDNPQREALTAFIDRYPHCRYVLLTSTPFLQSVGITPVVSNKIAFSVIRVKALKNSQVLSLIEKHGTKDPKQADKLLQRILVEAHALSVPITPVSGTFFIQIYTEDASKPLVNRANLVERYVEISLEKFASAEFLAGTFDFHNKADLLSDIAERMCREDTYDLQESTFLTWIREYMDRFGLKYSEVDLLNYFVEARILERVAGLVAFRLRAFMEYFAARRMDSDEDFRKFVLHPSRYLSFPNEISFYAAISRRDQGWMEELYDRYALNSDFVWSSSPKEVREGTLIEHFVIPNSDATEDEVLAVERQILDAELTDAGRKELLSTDASGDELVHKRVYRPKINEPQDAWIDQLSLLSSMLKNMELVKNPIKTKILKAVVQGWIQFICLALGLVPALAKEKTITFSGVKYEMHFPENVEIGELARRLFISIPISVLKVAYQHLGSEKLQLQLEEGLGDDPAKTSAGQQFVRVALLALMGTENVSEKLKVVGDRLEGRKYLSEVLLRHMYELAVRFRLPDHELQEIRGLAATLATRLEGTPAKDVGKRKSQIINSLTHSRLVIGLDPDTRDSIKKLEKRR